MTEPQNHQIVLSVSQREWELITGAQYVHAQFAESARDLGHSIEPLHPLAGVCAVYCRYAEMAIRGVMAKASLADDLVGGMISPPTSEDIEKLKREDPSKE